MALGDKYYLLVFDNEKQAKNRIRAFRKRNKCEELVICGDDFEYGDKWIVKIRAIEDGNPIIRKMMFVYENKFRILNTNIQPNVKELLQKAK
jgi:hypothetical protein